MQRGQRESKQCAWMELCISRLWQWSHEPTSGRKAENEPHTHRHTCTAFVYGGTDLKDKDSEPWELQTLSSALPLQHMAATVQAHLR